MRYTSRFSADENPSTLDKMISSLPRPSTNDPSPTPVHHPGIDAAPVPTIPSGPRPLNYSEKPGFFRKLFQKRPSTAFLRRKSVTQPSSPSLKPTEMRLPPLPKNEAIVLETTLLDTISRKAKLVFNGDESIAGKSAAAAWLGGPGEERAMIRKVRQSHPIRLLAHPDPV